MRVKELNAYLAGVNDYMRSSHLIKYEVDIVTFYCVTDVLTFY